MKAYKIEIHSFVDLITNSSTEMFMSSDKNIVEFFKQIGNIGGDRGSYIKVLTFKEFFKESYLHEMKEDSPEYYEKKYGKFKDDDEILIIQEDSEDCESLISQLMNTGLKLLHFERIE